MVEEGLSKSFSGGGGKPSFPSPSAGDIRELPRVSLSGRDWGQEEKGTTEDQVAGWHHGLDGHGSGKKGQEKRVKVEAGQPSVELTLELGNVRVCTSSAQPCSMAAAPPRQSPGRREGQLV